MSRLGLPSSAAPVVKARGRIIVESVATVLVAYAVAGLSEATLIRVVRPTELEPEAIAAIARENSHSATTICHALMARAREGHGPPGITQWDDDRTVVVVTVSDATSTGVPDSAKSDHIERDL